MEIFELIIYREYYGSDDLKNLISLGIIYKIRLAENINGISVNANNLKGQMQ